MDYITPIRQQLEEKMHQHCKAFIESKKGRTYSPRWYNICINNKKIVIGSSQFNGKLFFEIDYPVEYNVFDMDANEFWRQFREFRTDFLTEHYKTIQPY
jgi:hypothetical protein